MTDREVMKMAMTALQENWRTDQGDLAIEALRTALAQPAPVTTLFGSLPVYDVPPSEPVACKTCESLARAVMMDQTSHDTRREWVGLTDEEIKVCAKGGRSIGISFHDAICRAEAKLKEKNT